MGFESSEYPEEEGHAEEFSDVLGDLMDDVHERISTGQIPPPMVSDSDSLEFADIIDENAIDNNNHEHVENESDDDESEGNFWKGPVGIIIQIFIYIVLFSTMW